MNLVYEKYSNSLTSSAQGEKFHQPAGQHREVCAEAGEF